MREFINLIVLNVVKKSTLSAFIAAVLIGILLFSSCGGRRVPNLEAIFAKTRTQTGKLPIIVIPGILGSELVNEDTGELVWLSLFTSLNDDLRLPISPNLAENHDSLVPRKIIERAKLLRFAPEVAVYESLLVSLRRFGGYAEGDWEKPAPNGDHDTFYVFAYDWRLDNVENARKLVRDIESLKQKLNRPDLKFNVLAHSMGGLITRYAAMYGDQDLSAKTPQPNWNGAKYFHKIFMFGTPNEGSMSSFQGLLEGYSISTFTGTYHFANMSREVALTAPSMFQLMPHDKTYKFLDENFKPLEVDLYDIKTWRKYNWGAISDENFLAQFVGGEKFLENFSKKQQRKLRRSTYNETQISDLDAYFSNTLARAKDFHRALDVKTEIPDSLTIFSFGSDCGATLTSPVLVRDKKQNRWLTILRGQGFRKSDGTKVSSNDVKREIFAAGDNRVTRSSMLAENIAEQNGFNPIFNQKLPMTVTFFCEDHAELPNNATIQDNFLTNLLSEVMH